MLTIINKWVNITMYYGEIVRLDEINKSIEIKKEDIKFVKKFKFFSVTPLFLLTAGFITFGCIYSKLWFLGMISSLPSLAIAYVSTTSIIKRDKKKLKELYKQRNRTDLEEEKIVNDIYQKDVAVAKSGKINKSLISNKIENIESKKDDLTL